MATKNKPYTVIGLYCDNQQPWMAHVMAKDPRRAAIAAMKKLENGPDKCDIDNLVAIEVIEGKVRGVLGNDEPLSLTTLKARKQ
jgi:hypothetical protein